ncbi:uncharacterized protein LOC129589990 [Paramacrobiotus metropolitanus]|uniref:uncharacterized protein LOC129589990 n=1 Tax=Paramacrobiotus metropolitanus TaxID=2943436 RepID=UPI0024462A26|nr:uncharacterized protein LOC129589990 [Paramacrobiotus metropolitanus]
MAAKYLQMDHAVKMAEKILREIMERPENVLRMWRLARRDGLVDLERLACAELLQPHPRRPQFVDSEMFLQCSKEEVSHLLDQEFVPHSEATLYQAVVRWYMHDAGQRMHQMLDKSIVWDHLDIEPLVASTTGPLHAALTRIRVDRHRGLLGGGASLQRAMPKEAIFYHMSEDHPHQLLRFDFIRNELTKLDSPLQATLAGCWRTLNGGRGGYAMAVGRELIVDTYDTVLAMDCITGTTRTLMERSPFSEWEHFLSAVAVGGKLYCALEKEVGGFGENWYCYDMATGQVRRIGPVSRYEHERIPERWVRFLHDRSDPDSGQWVSSETIDKMRMDGIRFEELEEERYRGVAGIYLRYHRSLMEACVLPNNRICFLSAGSFIEEYKIHPESIVEFYDIPSNTWTKHTGWKDETKVHHRCGVIVCHGYLYFTGGCMYPPPLSYWESDGIVTTVCYRVSLTLADAQPERIADLNVARYHHGVFIKDGQIWVYGGTTHVDGDNQRKRALTSFEAYDAETDQWTVMDVPLSKELQAEAAGGNYAQKTVCLPLQHRHPPVCSGRYIIHAEDDIGEPYRMTEKYRKKHGLLKDKSAADWPTGLDD